MGAQGCCKDAACGAPLYTPSELALVPPEALLGQGSGNPVRHAGLRPGELVVDLGSGAGVDVFLAASKVGAGGRVVGVDMTPEMLERARGAAALQGAAHIEFRQGLIEELPIEAGVADAVLSNCVINLSPDKPAVFRESFRVLKPGGRLVVSDIVQEFPLGEVEDDCGCVSSAMLRTDYFEAILAAGFTGVRILEDRPWRSGQRGVEASAITVFALKPRGREST